MGIDISDTGSRQFALRNELKNFVGAGHDGLRQKVKKVDHLGDFCYFPKHQLSDDERMHDDITAVEKLGQLKIAATKMVDPDRRVSQHQHQTRLASNKTCIKNGDGAEPWRRDRSLPTGQAGARLLVR